MPTPKFELSGEIENDGVKKSKNRSIIGRFVLFVFVIFAISTVVFFPFLQNEFPALRSITRTDASQPGAEKALKAALNLIDSLKRVNDSLQIATQTMAGITREESTTGTWYLVQVGVSKTFDIEKYSDGLVNLHAEPAGDLTKLLLGKFTDAQTARQFLHEVQQLGFKDAWIVKKIDGERVPFEE